jgi:hypothetical protein
MGVVVADASSWGAGRVLGVVAAGAWSGVVGSGMGVVAALGACSACVYEQLYLILGEIASVLGGKTNILKKINIVDKSSNIYVKRRI